MFVSVLKVNYQRNLTPYLEKKTQVLEILVTQTHDREHYRVI